MTGETKNVKCQVLDLVFSEDARILVAACSDSIVRVFNLNDDSYFKSQIRQVSLPKVPISVSIVDDGSQIFIATSSKVTYYGRNSL